MAGEQDPQAGGTGQAPEGAGAADQGAGQNGQEQAGEALLRALEAERAEVKRLGRELAAAKRGKLTEAEQAIADARDEARREAVAEFGKKLARTALDAAVGRRNADYKVEELLEFVPIERFIGEAGDPDAKLIEQAVTRFVPEKAGEEPGVVDFGGGSRKAPPKGKSMNDLIRDRRFHR